MHKPTVHILLATYNGAQFLTEQLDSIARQTHSAWTLTISDDGSSDNTLDLVAQFAKRTTQPLTVLQGPQQKSSTRNFCHLIQNAHAAGTSDLYAFCDQDDVWLDDKLERTVQWHAQEQSHAVRLYCSRTQFVNEQLKPIGLSPGIQRPPSFGNALVQNIASGNTLDSLQPQQSQVLGLRVMTTKQIDTFSQNHFDEWTAKAKRATHSRHIEWTFHSNAEGAKFESK